MKLYMTQKFGLPGAGRYVPNGAAFFGKPVIPPTVMRETTRLVLHDTADHSKNFVVDYSTTTSRALWRSLDPNRVPPRGNGPDPITDVWGDDEEDYGFYIEDN